MSGFIQQNSIICKYKNDDSWVVLTSLEQEIKMKIDSFGVPLSKWNIKINRGIITGLNEAFIITKEKREEILKYCQSEDEFNRTDELIRPLLRGRDIDRYGYKWKNLYIINFHNGIPAKAVPALKIEDFPSLKNHFDTFYQKLEKRDDQGITPYNLRSCAYWDDFSKDKIVYSDISQRLSFCISEKGEFINNTAYYIMGPNMKMLKYITVVMNSSLMNWYYRTLSVQLGEKAVRMFTIYVNALPIPPKPSDDILESFVQLYDKIDENKMNSTYDEKEIDLAVCNLYSLSPSETEFIMNKS